MEPTVTINLKDYELYKNAYEVVQQQGKIVYVTYDHDGFIPYSSIRTTHEVIDEMSRQNYKVNSDLQKIVDENRTLKSIIKNLERKIYAYENKPNLDNLLSKKWYQFWK